MAEGISSSGLFGSFTPAPAGSLGGWSPMPSNQRLPSAQQEEWSKVTDAAEIRRIQNRIAQRNYRKKLKKRLEDLERRGKPEIEDGMTREIDATTCRTEAKRTYSEQATPSGSGISGPNPPCNTLYIGNLPMNTSEDELKALMSTQDGYQRFCFRTKQNGPMCLVEFDDISSATKH